MLGQPQCAVPKFRPRWVNVSCLLGFCYFVSSKLLSQCKWARNICITIEASIIKIIVLTLTTLKYCCINHREQKFLVWNHNKCLIVSYICLIWIAHLCYGSAAIINIWFSSARGPNSDVNIWRLYLLQILTSKVERVKQFYRHFKFGSPTDLFHKVVLVFCLLITTIVVFSPFY